MNYIRFAPFQNPIQSYNKPRSYRPLFSVQKNKIYSFIQRIDQWLLIKLIDDKNTYLRPCFRLCIGNIDKHGLDATEAEAPEDMGYFHNNIKSVRMNDGYYQEPDRCADSDNPDNLQQYDFYTYWRYEIPVPSLLEGKCRGALPWNWNSHLPHDAPAG